MPTIVTRVSSRSALVCNGDPVRSRKHADINSLIDKDLSVQLLDRSCQLVIRVGIDHLTHLQPSFISCR